MQCSQVDLRRWSAVQRPSHVGLVAVRLRIKVGCRIHLRISPCSRSFVYFLPICDERKEKTALQEAHQNLDFFL